MESSERMGKRSCSRTCVFALACLTIFSFITPTYQQTVSITREDVPVSVGEPYTITCQISGNLEAIGYIYWNIWSNDTNPPSYQTLASYFYPTQSKGWNPNVDESNFDLVWEQIGLTSATFQLTFKTVRCENQGRYQCALPTHGTSTAITQITVTVDPDYPTLYINDTVDVTNKELTLSIGQPATIRCSGVTGFPEGELAWFSKIGISTRKLIQTSMLYSRIVTGGCAYEGSTRVNFTMTKDMNGTKYWCYAFQRTSGFIMDSVITKTYVLVKLPVVKTAAQANCYEAGTCGGASSFGISTAVLLGVFLITALHMMT